MCKVSVKAETKIVSTGGYLMFPGCVSKPETLLAGAKQF
jgi:hypothetical protein